MMKKLLISSAVLLFTLSTVFSQNRPFPQQVNYPGCIKPNNVTQASMNTSVSDYYNYWKANYLKNDLSSLPGGYYVKGEITGGANGYTPLGSSEGQGYGMIITALMAGYDANAKTYFDGLFKTARVYRSSINSNLMGWVVADDINAQGDFSAATDGDMDIAYALLLAHYQWGSGGTINYLEEAKKMITNGIKADEINSSKRTNLGDWDNNAYNTRPSDWMPGHMHAYNLATGDAFWNDVANTVYSMIATITTNHSSSTGLMPDFVVGATPSPANPDFLEGPNDGNYYYNACRYPLRIVLDYGHFGTTEAKNAADKVVNWAKTKTGNNPGGIRAGYTLAGNDLSGNNYQSAIFIAPMVAAGVVDAAHQNWVNSGWTTIRNMKAAYFEDSYNLLTMLFISGNWWAPVPDESNVAPTVSITSPANNASFTQGQNFTINATASDADGSISKVAFYLDGAYLGEDNSSPYSINASSLITGAHTLTAIATDDKGKSTTSAGITINITVNTTQTPFNGTPFTIPGMIEAEQYDLGMLDIAYKDMTAENEGGATYRNDQVDVEACTDAGLGYNIGYIVQGEWLEYTVDVKEAAAYTLDVRVAATAVGKTFHIELDGINISGAITVPNTGDWQAWQTVSVTTPTLTTGIKVLRIVMDSGDFNLNYVIFTKIHVNESPTVSLTSPANSSVHIAGTAITLSADATDSDGSIAKVEFYNGVVKIGEDAVSPYSISWTPAIGSYTITAKAIDNENASTISTGVSITVKAANVKPTVSLSSPTNGSVHIVETAITVSADATDSDGSIAKVEFYNGAVKIGEDAVSPYSISWTPAIGSYTITAKAIDNENASTTSTGVSITVKAANVKPIVSLTSPTNGSVYIVETAINVSADATDSDGSIAKVEFYNGAVKIGEDAVSPYSISWTPAIGSYTITAKAIDNENASTTSTGVSITVKAANVKPTVSLTSPTNGSVHIVETAITVSADATDSDGSIAKVEFYNGAVKIGEDAVSPYSISWTPAIGSYTITAKAIDNENASTISTGVSITVKAANVKPTVSLISPTNGSVHIVETAITVSADATDSDGSIAKVEFYNGAVKIGEDAVSPYSISWTPAIGSYTITAKAIDNENASTISTGVSITVKAANVKPTVSLTSPTNGSVHIVETAITVSADATDSDGSIAKVEFYNGAVKIGEDAVSPYSISWTPAIGSYTITAKAIDNENASTISTGVSITVKAANVKPTVSLTSPTNGSVHIVETAITVSADATDSDGSIAKVEFYNGAVKIGEDAVSPYSISWTPAIGSYTITAKAIDNENESTTSTGISITVKAANVKPTVSLTSPTNGSVHVVETAITVSADATDSDGSIAKVEFYNGAVKIGEDAVSPYSISWTPAIGSYTITAKAIDNENESTTSTGISITVKAANVKPIVSLTSPIDEATYLAGTSISISANATDTDGSIAKVEFYNGTEKIGEASSEPYTIIWTPAVGTYMVTAKAIDDENAFSISSEVTIEVNKVTSITYGTNNSYMSVINPFSEVIVVQMGDNISGYGVVEVYNMYGEVVGKLFEGNIVSNQEFTLNTSHLAKGFYLLKASVNGVSDVKKLVKE